MEIRTINAKGKPKNILAGSINNAIEKAERYGTKLVIRQNGKIKELSSKQMTRKTS